MYLEIVGNVDAKHFAWTGPEGSMHQPCWPCCMCMLHPDDDLLRLRRVLLMTRTMAQPYYSTGLYNVEMLPKLTYYYTMPLEYK